MDEYEFRKEVIVKEITSPCSLNLPNQLNLAQVSICVFQLSLWSLVVEGSKGLFYFCFCFFVFFFPTTELEDADLWIAVLSKNQSFDLGEYFIVTWSFRRLCCLLILLT